MKEDEPPCKGRISSKPRDSFAYAIVPYLMKSLGYGEELPCQAASHLQVPTLHDLCSLLSQSSKGGKT